jgi:two-component system LytT family response regulator
MNALIVDDEKKACANLKNMLHEYIDPDINIVGIANSTLEAEALLNAHNPDVVFLDIEMPNENAFHFLERISPVNFEIIFVTAYDEFAVKAFKLNAVDYILKPISIPELKNAVEKLSERLHYKKMKAVKTISYAALSNEVINRVKLDKITLRDFNSIEIVEFKDIHFVEAQSSYSRIVFTKDNGVKEMTLSYPLSNYEEILPADIFFRVHRSYLVNCMHIKNILYDNSNQVIMTGDLVLPVSRRRFTAMLDFLRSKAYIK